MNTLYTLPLDSPAANLATVGGKGASLCRLAQAGLPVPPGFHVTTAAYQRFVAANDLQARLLAIAETAHADDPASLDAASAAISALFAAAPIPADVADAVCAAYAALATADGPPPTPMAVAVRSSATAEDLPEASFAGQAETYLNVQGADNVLEAVRRCWASLWTARALGYRAHNQIEPGSVTLAVVVQALVAPSTDPAWTPLFMAAGGLVMEAGGVMSHGSVVAREYGIPAVVGVADATERLRTGQRVTVDGSAGRVFIEGESVHERGQRPVVHLPFHRH